EGIFDLVEGLDVLGLRAQVVELQNGVLALVGLEPGRGADRVRTDAGGLHVLDRETGRGRARDVRAGKGPLVVQARLFTRREVVGIGTTDDSVLADASGGGDEGDGGVGGDGLAGGLHR